MTTTREEAIKILEHLAKLVSSEDYQETFKMAASALRPITKEQVEKVWRGKWVGMTDDDGCTWYECSRCEYGLDSLEDPNHFCPACGAPMTDEAVDMVMERINEMEGTENGLG